MAENTELMTVDNICNRVYVIRGQQVMLDYDLAEIYGYEVKRLNEQVKRNIKRFPEDFMFQLTTEEDDILKSQIATSSWGGKRKLPYALANQMDNLSVSDKHYDKKYEDMQVRLDKLYDEIEEIETLIEEVETRLYNIRQEKISGDNVYQFLLFFDKLYDRFTDIEKKTFMKSFLADVNIYGEEQDDGRILRSLKFRFPVFFNGKEIYELDWDNESIVEKVCVLSKNPRYETLINSHIK